LVPAIPWPFGSASELRCFEGAFFVFFSPIPGFFPEKFFFHPGFVVGFGLMETPGLFPALRRFPRFRQVRGPPFFDLAPL